jgi:hypothetical protein
MKLSVEIEDVRDWHACEKALKLICKTLRKYHREQFAKNIALCILGEDEDRWRAEKRFGDACSRFRHAELRLILEYCAMDKPSKQDLAKMLAQRNQSLPRVERYARGSTSEKTMLQQIKRVFKGGRYRENCGGFAGAACGNASLL